MTNPKLKPIRQSDLHKPELIQRSIEIEPRLIPVVEKARKINTEARSRTIYWCDIWLELKKDLWPLVGDGASQTELRTSEYYDLWYDYLMALTPSTL